MTPTTYSMARHALALLALGAAACGPKPKPDDKTVRAPEILRERDVSWFVSGGKRYVLTPPDPRDVLIKPRLELRLPEGVGTPPDRYMLDERGWITRVQNQHSRGACTVFAAIGAIESEYLRRHGVTLDLSEQYVINMMNENRHPAWVGGAAAEKLSIASRYAVPLEVDWKYPDLGPAAQQVDAVFGFDRAADAAGGDALDKKIWEQSLERDLANYGTAVFPNAAAHQAAVYGPMPGAVAAVPLDGTATPLEKVIFAGHPIAFSTSMGSWSQNAAGQFVYGSAAPVNHTMLLVGYDRTRKVFRVKNSWGDKWNGNGFAEASYELITKTITSAVYVTAVRPPGQASPGAGTGALRGFWRGGISGGEGVMVLRHPFVDPGGLNLAGADAGTLYLGASDTRGLTWVSGTADTMTLDVKGDAVITQLTLTRDGDGWALSGTGTQEGRVVTLGGRWCRTAVPRPATLTPASYAAAVNDPQVFPAGDCQPSSSWSSSVQLRPRADLRVDPRIRPRVP